MGLVDKIKNAFFEVEYVEVDKEDTKKEKEKPKDNKQDEQMDKPIAKRVILSNHKKEKTKEDLEDISRNNIEEEKESLPPIVEEQPKQNEFQEMNDNDFRTDDFPHVDDEPVKYDRPAYEKSYEDEIPHVEERVIYRQEVRETHPYGIDESNKNLVQEYGRAYEKKDERSGFKPSPIISPIYGVLDKNYRKEDVREKGESRSSYSRENMNVDDVRNKAYGSIENRRTKHEEEEKKKTIEEERPIFEEEEEDTNLLVDLSNDNGKPSVKEVTMGDALEYFQDLGLEYNVDYMDASKEKATGRRVRENYDDGPELFSIENKKDEEEILEEDDIPPVVKNNDIDVENDDNLFDLIDSMYDEDK